MCVNEDELMSTAHGPQDCPQCGYPEAQYYSTYGTETTLSCPMCGYYYYSGSLARAEDYWQGDGLKTDPLCDEFVEGCKKGYGVWCVRLVNGKEENGRWENQPTHAEIWEFEATVNNDSAIDPTGSFATVWDDDTKSLRVVVGQMPERYVVHGSGEQLASDDELPW